MIKALVLLSLVAVAFSWKIFSYNTFGNEKNLEGESLRDYVQKGASITYDMQAKIRSVVENAYIFNGNNTVRNIQFIQQQMSNTYMGNWIVGMYGAWGNETDPTFRSNVGISAYSVGGQSWIYWKGANHYQSNIAYYLAKQDGYFNNYTSSVCVSQDNYTTASETFTNIASAAELDYSDIQVYTSQIQQFLRRYDSGAFPTVTAVSNSLPFYFCSWGSYNGSYNLIQRTNKYRLTVASTPRVY